MAQRKTIEHHLKTGPFDAKVARPDTKVRVLELREEGAFVEAMSFGKPFRTIAKVGAIRCKPMPKKPRPRSDEAIFVEKALREKPMAYPELFDMVKEAGLDEWAVRGILASFCRVDWIGHGAEVVRIGPDGRKRAYWEWKWIKKART